MISPGLLGSGPVRVVIDMVGAAKGNATESCVLSGLLETGGEEGPALAADMFAAFIAAETATSESASRSRVSGPGTRVKIGSLVGPVRSP